MKIKHGRWSLQMAEMLLSHDGWTSRKWQRPAFYPKTIDKLESYVSNFEANILVTTNTKTLDRK